MEICMNRVMTFVGAAAAAVMLLAPAATTAQSKKAGLLEIEGKPTARPHDMTWLTGTTDPSLRELVAAVQWAGKHKDMDTLVIRLKDAKLEWSQIEELGRAMKQAQKSGKKIAVFAENYGPGELLLGTYADSVLIQQGGAVSLPGLYMQEMFLADALGWLGVKAELVQVGDYKGASEALVNSKPSKAWDENINQLLDSMYANMRQTIKQGRTLDDAQLDAAMERVWLAFAEDAIEVGLVDAAVDLPRLGSHLAGGAGDVSWVEVPVGSQSQMQLDSNNPFAALSSMMQMFGKPPKHGPKGPAIALLHIDGAIVDGESSSGGLFGGASVGSRTIRNALEEIFENDKIKGVVVRIDSPGGSAIASEVIWTGLRRVAEKKPVWVSVGSMAASGGYYIAVAAEQIYVNPSSIVGSIGVVGGKIAMSGLYDKLRINTVGRARGPMADLLASPEPWTAEQTARIREKMASTYDLFTRRVAAGREGIDLGKTAEGRLFTGDKAVALKMADKVGGLDESIGDLASKLGLKDYEVVDYPAPKSFAEMLEDLFKGMGMASASAQGSRSEVVGLLRSAVGPEAWPAVSTSLEAMLQFRRQPVLLIMPRTLVIH
jgi:protease IV